MAQPEQTVLSLSEVITQIAVENRCDERTVLKVLGGRAVRGRVADEVLAALHAYGIPAPIAVMAGGPSAAK